MRRHRICCLACLALLVSTVGCGTSDSTSQRSNLELVRAALFKPADLPKGWQSQPLIHDRPCGGNPTRSAVATSASHLGGGLADIQQKVTIFETQEAAKEVYRRLGSPRGIACFRSIVQHAVMNRGGGALLKPLTVLHRTQDGNFLARRMVLIVESPIGPAAVYVDDIKGQMGRGIITVKVSSGLAPIPESFYKRVLETTKRRLLQMRNG